MGSEMCIRDSPPMKTSRSATTAPSSNLSRNFPHDPRHVSDPPFPGLPASRQRSRPPGNRGSMLVLLHDRREKADRRRTGRKTPCELCGQIWQALQPHVSLSVVDSCVPRARAVPNARPARNCTWTPDPASPEQRLPGRVISALRSGPATVSYTHLTLPTICSV